MKPTSGLVRRQRTPRIPREKQTIESDEQGCGEAFCKGVQNARRHVDGGLHWEPPGKCTLKPQPAGRLKQDMPAPAGAENPARGAAGCWDAVRSFLNHRTRG